MGTQAANGTGGLPNSSDTEGFLQSNSTDDLMKATHNKYLMAYMPIIVFMSITTVVGIVGNIFTILFYGVKARKTSTIVFILALAALDLISCFMACTTIADMSVNVYFEGRYLCKVMYFFDHWAVVSSVLVLWVISIDRYRKICKSFGRQFKRKSAVYAVLVLIGASLVSSVPSLINYEIVAVNISAPDGKKRVLGNYCTNTDKAEMSAVVTVFHVFDAIVIFSVFVTFVLTYGKIWHVLRKHRKKCQTIGLRVRASKEVSSSERICSSAVSLNKSASADSLDSKFSTRILSNNSNLQRNDSRTAGSNCLEVPQFNVVQPRKSDTSTTAKASKSERNITIMMLAVSVGFVVCFTPYFFVTALRIATPTGEHELEPWIQFLLRFPFYNSVINPIIFCFFNPQFRRYIKEVMLGCNVRQYAFSSTS